MSIPALAIISSCATLIQDTDYVRWSQQEWLGWLNDGQREILVFKPNAYVRNQSVQLAAGTKQTLPADAVQLIDVIRNMGTTGGIPGRAVRITERETLDAYNPNWHAATASAEVRHYMYSLLDPKTFYVYPPQPASTRGWVELAYGATPPDVGLGDNIAVDDIYKAVLIDYMMYRAYSKDSEYAPDASRAATHQQAYIASLTGKARSEVGANPNSMAPASPNVPPVPR